MRKFQTTTGIGQVVAFVAFLAASMLFTFNTARADDTPCELDTECKDPTPFCVEEKCVQCPSNEFCPTGMKCEDGACVTFTSREAGDVADDDGATDGSDPDGDGLETDACPTEPEDYDAFQDADGCPDPDNDGDGLLDANDTCPNESGTFANKGCKPDPSYPTGTTAEAPALPAFTDELVVASPAETERPATVGGEKFSWFVRAEKTLPPNAEDLRWAAEQAVKSCPKGEVECLGMASGEAESHPKNPLYAQSRTDACIRAVKAAGGTPIYGGGQPLGQGNVSGRGVWLRCVPQQAEPVPGPPGKDGRDGFHCWDLNMDRQCQTMREVDLNGDGKVDDGMMLEDVNLNGSCTVEDCKGEDGDPAPAGALSIGPMMMFMQLQGQTLFGGGARTRWVIPTDFEGDSEFALSAFVAGLHEMTEYRPWLATLIAGGGCEYRPWKPLGFTLEGYWGKAGPHAFGSWWRQFAGGDLGIVFRPTAFATESPRLVRDLISLRFSGGLQAVWPSQNSIESARTFGSFRFELVIDLTFWAGDDEKD